jgi:hypothetical protein
MSRSLVPPEQFHGPESLAAYSAHGFLSGVGFRAVLVPLPGVEKNARAKITRVAVLLLFMLFHRGGSLKQLEADVTGYDQGEGFLWMLCSEVNF